MLKHCLIGHGHSDFVEKVERSIENSAPMEQISDSIKDESWEAKVEELRKIVKMYKQKNSKRFP